MTPCPPVFLLRRNIVEMIPPWQCCDLTMTPFLLRFSNSESTFRVSSGLNGIYSGGSTCVGGRSTNSTLKPLTVLRICQSDVNSLHSGGKNFSLTAGLRAGSMSKLFERISCKSAESGFTFSI